MGMDARKVRQLRYQNPELFRVWAEKKLYKSKLRREELTRQGKGFADSLETFALEAWKVIEPSTPFVSSWFYPYIFTWLESVSSGKFKKLYPQKKGLVINCPPRVGKSN